MGAFQRRTQNTGAEEEASMRGGELIDTPLISTTATLRLTFQEKLVVEAGKYID